MNPSNSKAVISTAKNLTVFVALILSFALIFFSRSTFSTVPTQDCATLTGSGVAGVNCLYYSLPLCQTIPGRNIDPGAVLAAGTVPNHRSNCADLSDMPLCTQLPSTSSIYSTNNCATECSAIGNISGQTRGADYAVHNTHCVRFCDAPETGFNLTLDPGRNCSIRSCHQLPSGTQPNPPTNCKLLSCKMLTPVELNFQSNAPSNYNYCDNDTKCYNFSQAQVPYLRSGRTCKIHDCRASCVDNATDDVQKIINRGGPYQTAYQHQFTNDIVVSSPNNVLCNPVICKTIVDASFICGGNNEPPTAPDPACNTACTNGYCQGRVDCNQAQYANSTYCVGASSSDDDTTGTVSDDGLNSWFYRPKPENFAVRDSNGNGIFNDFNTNSNLSYDSTCYSINQLKDLNLGDTISILGINMGYFYAIWEDSPSPKKCHAADLGIRGTGYAYLCGTAFDIGNLPDSRTGYQYGSVSTTFSSNDGIHVEKVCLRFNAGGAIEKSCGKRQCQLSCAFAEERDNSGCTQICGGDVCVGLTVKDSDPYQCMMTDNLFNYDTGENLSGTSSTHRDCMKTIDGYLRIRAVKYGDYICNFLDVKGTLAYNGIYFDGSKQILGGKYCASGTKTGDNSCSGGKNTNDAPGLAEKWRTVLQIPYIQNNQPNGKPHGYLDLTGRLFPEQECIKAPNRVPTPRLYNLGNIENSPHLFTPPLYILNALVKRNGAIAMPSGNDQFGVTDFHYPALTLSFGPTTQVLSLGFGKTGYEDQANADPLGSATVSASILGGGSAFSKEVFVRKEFEPSSNRPSLCLYQKVKDSNGVYLEPHRIACVYRDYPEINNSETVRWQSQNGLPTSDLRKIMVSADASNTYSNSKIVFQYLSGTSLNATCGSGSCSAAISLANNDPNVATCDTSLENYRICVKRDECSALNNECVLNEINLQNARIANQSINAYVEKQNSCITLLQKCNNKFGVNTAADASIINSTPNLANADPKAYGWFNEICISSGFETKLRQVIAKTTDNGLMGKCLIDTTAQRAGANCSAGGKKPDCPCLAYTPGTTLNVGQYLRTETPHEAGLCIDIALPQLCPVIDHNPVPSSNQNDQLYIASSLGQSTYGTTLNQATDVVNLSHKIRSFGLGDATVANTVTNNFGIDNIPVAGHADFKGTLFGVNGVTGVCNGFWKKNVINGVEAPPTMNCLNNNGTAAWGPLTNPCVRYYCPAISTSGANPDGSYPGNYASVTDPITQKGLKNGFAVWPQFTKTNDALENTANSTTLNNFIACIPGYKKQNSTPVSSTYTNDPDAASRYGVITGYTGGITPSRSCDQLGNWGNVANSCQRITCPAIPVVTPTSSSDTQAWQKLENSGGASFAQGSASLSQTAIIGDNTTVSGTCNNSIGFYAVSSEFLPTRTCDYLGNWGPVQNACVTTCNAINFSSSSHGFAAWDQSTGVTFNSSSPGRFTSCISNGNPNFGIPGYPPLRNNNNVAYTLVDSNPDYITTIPRDVSADTRVGNSVTVNGTTYTGFTPERLCVWQGSIDSESQKWTAPSGSCTSKCPGAFSDGRTGDDIDNRINAGITRHNTLSGQINVYWGATDIGNWDYQFSPGSNSSTQSISQYYNGRTNGVYALARYCNPNTHRWDAPIPLCVTNNVSGSDTVKFSTNGSIVDSLASYPSNPFYIGVSGAPAANGPSLQTAAGTCKSGAYYTDSNNNVSAQTPQLSCVYKSGSTNIDEVYLQTNGATLCTYMCQSQLDKTFGGAIDKTSDVNGSYYPPGETAQSKLNLSCQEGKGSVITNVRTNSPFAGCGRGNYSDRSESRPYVTCNATETNGVVTGAAWSTVTNDCSNCRNCTANSPFNVVANYTDSNITLEGSPSCLAQFTNGDGTRNYDCYYLRSKEGDPATCGNDNGSDLYVWHPAPTIPSLNNGEVNYFCEYQEHDNDSSAGFGIKCLDGTLNVKVACFNNTGAGGYNNGWSSANTVYTDGSISAACRGSGMNSKIGF